MLVLSAAARSGTSRGVATAAGTVTRVYARGVAAAAGASAVLTASETTYSLLKAAGAALPDLARRQRAALLVQASSRGSRRLGGGASPAGVAAPVLRTWSFHQPAQPEDRRLLHQLPAAVPPSDVAALPAGVLLTSVHVVEGLFFLAAICYLADRAGDWLRRPRVSRALDRICAPVFIGFGVRLAVTRSARSRSPVADRHRG
jgi:hypothetical protein